MLNLKLIKNPAHRKILEYYGYRMASTPLKTAFHRIPTLEDLNEILKPKYNLSKYVLDDLIYRYYVKSNVTCLIFGPRSDYKSTMALRLKLWCEEIAKIKTDYNKIVDTDVDLLNFFANQTHPPFTTFIKDEWDTVRSGIGNMTISDTVKNVINRVRYYQLNLIICTPVLKFYPVDYFFEVYEYQRFGNKRVLMIIYNEKLEPKGHVILPMPSDKEISCYDERKKYFMLKMKKLHFNIDEELIDIAEEAIKDPKLPEVDNSKASKIILGDYLALKYPQLQSKSMKENIVQKILYMKKYNLSKLPKPTNLTNLRE